MAGDTYVDGVLNVGVLNPVTDSDNTAILGQTAAGYVKELNVTIEGAAIAYFQEYELFNLGGGGDWVDDFDTSIDATRYVVTVISAYFSKGLEMSAGSANNFVIPYVSASISDGTWHITADYASANPVSSGPAGRWIVSTLILSKDFSKQLSQQVVNLSNGRTGTATSPIID